MSRILHLQIALILSGLAIAACGIPPTARFGDVAGQTSPTTKTTADPTTTTTSNEPVKTTSDCPVTIPPQPGFVATEPEDVTYSENFPAPDPWPREFPGEDMVWYGTAELWTALDVNGNHSPRKSVWWSVNFPGGIVEGEPEVWVTWTLLDTDETVVIDNHGKATNAYTPDQGWFIIAGIDPDQPGCWEVEAMYKGARLGYVYERSE
ncbi:MAG TPA: hypothetical protein VE569_02200 [Acidimicrobiia bacterium]|nr:hypothetical protein [Acidimicrobiia bacterium]